MSYTELEIRQSTLDRILVMLESSYKDINQQDWLNLAITFTELNKTDLLYVDKVEALLIDSYSYAVDKIDNPKELVAMVNRLKLLQAEKLPTPIISCDKVSAGNIDNPIEIMKTEQPMINIYSAEINVKIEVEVSGFERFKDEIEIQNTPNIVKRLKPLEINNPINAWIRVRSVTYASDGKPQRFSDWTQPLHFYIKTQVIIGMIESVTYPTGLPANIPTTGQYRRIGVPFRDDKWYAKTDVDYEGMGNWNNGGTHNIESNTVNNQKLDVIDRNSKHFKFFYERTDHPLGKMKKIILKTEEVNYKWEYTEIHDYKFDEDIMSSHNSKIVGNDTHVKPYVKIPDHYIIDCHVILIPKGTNTEHFYYLKLLCDTEFTFDVIKYLKNLPGFEAYYDFSKTIVGGRVALPYKPSEYNKVTVPGRGGILNGNVLTSVYQYGFYMGALPGGTERAIGNMGCVYPLITKDRNGIVSTQEATTQINNKGYNLINAMDNDGTLPMNFVEWRTILFLMTIEKGYIGMYHKWGDGWGAFTYNNHINGNNRNLFNKSPVDFVNANRIMTSGLASKGYHNTPTGYNATPGSDTKVYFWRGIELVSWIQPYGCIFDANGVNPSRVTFVKRGHPKYDDNVNLTETNLEFYSKNKVSQPAGPIDNILTHFYGDTMPHFISTKECREAGKVCVNNPLTVAQINGLRTLFNENYLNIAPFGDIFGGEQILTNKVAPSATTYMGVRREHHHENTNMRGMFWNCQLASDTHINYYNYYTDNNPFNIWSGSYYATVKIHNEPTPIYDLGIHNNKLTPIT